MHYVVLFEDEPSLGPDVRAKTLPAHLKFLAANADAIDSAGPLAQTDGTPHGGIWIVRADSEAAVQALVEADPFWPTGLRKSVRVLKWTQVFADGEVLV